MDDSRIRRSVGQVIPSGTGNGDTSNTVKFVVAALILGGVIGNMFAAKRLRTFQGVKPRTGNNYKPATDPWQAPSPSNHYYNAHIDERNYKANAERAASGGAGYGPYPPAGSRGSDNGSVNSSSTGYRISYNNTSTSNTNAHTLHGREIMFMQQYLLWKNEGYPHSRSSTSSSGANGSPSQADRYNDDIHRPRFTTPSSSSISSGSNIAFLSKFAHTGTTWYPFMNTLHMHELVAAKHVPNRVEIKEAYRRLALQLHPDTTHNSQSHSHRHGNNGIGKGNGNDNDKESIKDKYKEKNKEGGGGNSEAFAKATEAYRELLDKVDSLDARIGGTSKSTRK
jgi:hypothetical protein